MQLARNIRSTGGFLAASILVHAAAGALYYFLTRDRTPPAETEPRVVEHWVEESPSPRSGGAGNSRARSSRGQNNPAGKSDLSLNDLGIQWRRGEDGVAVPGNAGEDSPDHGNGGTGEGLIGKVKHASRFRTLYERIDQALEYPTELSQNNIHGVVTARLVFSPDGAFQKKRSQVISSSKFLRVLVHRLFRRVFAPDASRTPPWRGSDELVVQCTFEFSLTDADTSLPTGGDIVEDRRIFGNKFYFSRFAARAGSWQVGPMHGYMMMPSVGVDPDWFVQQLTPRKDTGDPLDQYRRDPEF